MSSIVTMPTSTPFESTTGSADAVVFAENVERFFLRIVHLERDEILIANLADLGRERLEQKFAHAQVVDQFAALIHDIDHVERLAVLTMLAHVIEHLLHRPIFMHRR